jgi:hypothetical protein
MNLCVMVEGSPLVNALPSSSSSTWPEMSNKSNPVSLLPHLVFIRVQNLDKFWASLAHLQKALHKRSFSECCVLKLMIIKSA